jgi:hypothetical protein
MSTIVKNHRSEPALDAVNVTPGRPDSAVQDAIRQPGRQAERCLAGMSTERLRQLRDLYRDGLLNDTLPFWIPRAIDRECGGYLHTFDRDGTVLHTDKAVWIQGRFAWLLATLYNTVESRPEWLELSRHGIEFLRKRGGTDNVGEQDRERSPLFDWCRG